MTTIGIIGCGQMGGGMWRNFKGKGQTAIVYDVREEATKPLAALGAPVAKSAKDLASKANVIVTSLPTSHDVERAMFGRDSVVEGAKAGTTVIDTTSGHPLVTRSIAERLREKGLRMIDCGVSGGPQGANAGTLRIMLGGESADIEEHMATIKLLGSEIHHCGAVGAGHAMKTLLNLRNQVVNTVTAEVLLIGAKFGLDPKLVGQVVGASGVFNSYIMNPQGRKAIGFGIGLASKDYDVAMSLANDLGVTALLSSTGQQIFRAVKHDQGADADVFSFVNTLEDWAHFTLPGRNETAK